MKLYTKSFLPVAAAVLLATALMTGCKDFLDINNSPNAISDANVKTIAGQYALAVGVQTTAFDFYSSDRSRMTSFFTWQMCAPPGLGRPQPAQWNGYLMQLDGPVQDCWNAGYHTNTVADQILTYAPGVSFSSAGERNILMGMADCYKAIALGELASLYGSIPIDINGLTPPQFATQADAFARVQSLLDDALAKFAAGGGAGLSYDLNFGGDEAKWTAVAHSLKARYYLAVSDYANALTQSRSGIASSAGTLNGIYTQTAGEYSPWGHWANDESGQPIRVEKSYMTLLKSEAGDTRLPAYFQKNSLGNYIGYAVHGETVTDSADTISTLVSTMNKYSAYDASFPLISYEENLLIKAECESRTGDDASATTDVNTIRTGAGLGATSATGAALIAEILKQKHLQLYLEGQTYTDMRRTKTLPAANVPVRFLYPVTETNANPNVPPDNDNLVNAIIK